jgi:vancomycin resistance protein YoaR
MTSTSETASLPIVEQRPSRRLRFIVAFVAGLLAVLALGVGALYGYDRQFEGRILPGVRIGSVDLSGLSPAAAAAQLSTAYASLGTGKLVLTSPDGNTTITYADIGRHVDVDGLVADAAAVGRAGSAVDRVIGNARTALRGVVLAPRVVFDQQLLASKVQAAAARLERSPIDAAVTTTATSFEQTPASDGRTADAGAALGAATAALSALDAPAEIDVAIPVTTVAPRISTEEATAATSAADLMAKDITLTNATESWVIKASTVRTWLRVTPTVDGGYIPLPNVVSVRSVVAKLATKIDRKALDASFVIGKGGVVFGVTAGHNGRKLDVAVTSDRILGALRARALNVVSPTVAASILVTTPALTTEEAQKAAPLLKKISTWTTWFPISERNHFGANIWLPAQFINGTVVAPGATFDFWKTVGPVTPARGFGRGGAIINGQTDPQGAIGGGICSNSTTLFNAALRAGMDMKARRNHFYYIDRYPLGLDATVFISSGGSKQTMSFRNDTAYPVLIRGIKIRGSGGRGFVRYDLYSVPNGRKVVIGAPTVRNVRPAWDSVQYTSSMKKGTSKRIESPVDGKDVWRTVSVYQDGKLIRQHTYYSHYSRITGVVLKGTG